MKTRIALEHRRESFFFRNSVVARDFELEQPVLFLDREQVDVWRQERDCLVR